VLHSEWINNNNSNSNNDGNHTIVFLHGLLLSGRNVQTMAKKMCAATDRPGLLVDLTGHGSSKGKNDLDQTVTFDTCLADIHATLVSAGIAGESDDGNHPKITLVGHSLGGRLALQYAHEQYHDRLQHLWLLDTVPGQPHASVVRILDAAEAVLEQHQWSVLGQPHANVVRILDAAEAVSEQQQWSGITRAEVTAVLRDKYKLEQATAAWLASGFTINPKTGKAAFAFDTQVARELVEDAGRQEFMYQLQQTVSRSDSDHRQNVHNYNNNHHPVRVDLVRGLKNTAWETCGHLPALHNLTEQQQDHFGIHTVQAGHNVHAEDLPGLMKAVDLVYKL
jgi:pimeloyl-ACP methyl ester carboxylesterase